MMLQPLRLWRCADDGALLELRQGRSCRKGQQQHLHPHLREVREGGHTMRAMILDSLAVVSFVAAMVLLLALGSMR